MRLIKKFKLNTRLKKIALGGNIQRSDVDFIYEDGFIKMILINNEKALHDQNESWEGEYYTDFEDESQDVIGYIEYNEWDLSTDDNKLMGIFVNYLEMRNEYRETRAVKFLLDEFKEKVINKNINEYGKENVELAADVVNPDLKDFLERMSKKIGIKFDPNGNFSDGFNGSANSGDDHPVNERVFYDELSKQGVDYYKLNGDFICVRNFPIDQYKQILRQSMMFSSEMFGYVESNGNIVYSADFEVESFYGDEITYFEVEDNNVKFKSTLDSVKDEVNEDNFKDQFYRVFPTSMTFSFNGVTI